jgi:hypothetical protein
MTARSTIATRIAGCALVLIGILGLAWGEIPYSVEKHSVELGPIEMRVSERKTLPYPTFVAVTTLVLGAVTLWVGFGRPPGRTSP